MAAPTSVLYRPMTAADLPAVKYLHHASGNATRASRGNPPAKFEAEELPWLSHLVETDPGGSWIAEVRGVPIGFATSSVRDDVWHLSQLFVHPDFYGRGAGKELTARAIAYGREGGAKHFCVSSSQNLAAQGLYMLNGMQALGLNYVMDGSPAGLLTLPPPAPGRAICTDLDSLQDQVDALDHSFGRGRRPQDHLRFRQPGSMWGDGQDGWLALTDAAGLVGYAYVSTSEGHFGPIAAREPADVLELLHAVGVWLRDHEQHECYCGIISANRLALDALVHAGFKVYSFDAYMASSDFLDLSRYIQSSGLLL